MAARLLAAPPERVATGGCEAAAEFVTRIERVFAGHASRLAAADVRQFAHAVDSGTAVVIEYVAASGNRTVRPLSELEPDPPHLLAWCRLRDDERMFTLSRIRGVLQGQRRLRQ